TPKMGLTSGGLSVGGTFVSSSDKRLKFNEKPLSNALGVINQLEPVEYDQTYDLVDPYTLDTPQSHQCGFIAQSVQTIDELKHAVVGGQVGDDGKETIRALNYKAIFTYAVKAIQELSQIVKAQQVQINELQQQFQNHLLTNFATLMS
ncbi:MAG: tail fiber domain-containing protein, partial [Candidatus Fonsibacter sp.]